MNTIESVWNRIKTSIFPSPKPIDPVGFAAGKVARGKQVVVVFGDSLTEGIFSANFVTSLQSEMGVHGYQFVNAGISADLAWNLLQRIDEVIACKPDRVVILVGTNDVIATLDQTAEKWYTRTKNLPHKPTGEWFRHNLFEIIRRLAAVEPPPQIGILSLGVVGEDLSSEINQKMKAYSAWIQETADLTGIEYLPLHERFRAYLEGKQGLQSANQYSTITWTIYRSVLQRVVLRRTWGQIGAGQGFHLLTDYVHYNETAAQIVQELIQKWLCDKQTEEAPTPPTRSYTSGSV